MAQQVTEKRTELQLSTNPLDHRGLARKFAKKWAASKGRPDLVDDFEQAALLRVVIACGKFEPDRGYTVATYLHRALHNDYEKTTNLVIHGSTARITIRKKGAITKPAPLHEQFDSNGRETDGCGYEDSQTLAFRMAMRRLHDEDPEAHEAVRLAFYHDMSMKDIAQQMQPGCESYRWVGLVVLRGINTIRDFCGQSILSTRTELATLRAETSTRKQVTSMGYRAQGRVMDGH